MVKEEALEFCIQYLGHTGLGVPMSRHVGRLDQKGTIREKSIRVREHNVLMQAHFKVLQQASVVLPYMSRCPSCKGD